MICWSSIWRVCTARPGWSPAVRLIRWIERRPSTTAATSSSSRKMTRLVCSITALQNGHGDVTINNQGSLSPRKLSLEHIDQAQTPTLILHHMLIANVLTSYNRRCGYCENNNSNKVDLCTPDQLNKIRSLGYFYFILAFTKACHFNPYFWTVPCHCH